MSYFNVGSTLGPGVYMQPGHALTNGSYKLALQSDGNLVLSAAGRLLKSWGVKGAQLLKMQTDGNLVLSRGNAALWATKTPGHAGAFLKLQSDGNVVLDDGHGRALWTAGTQGGRAAKKPSTNPLTMIAREVTGLGQTVSSATTGRHGLLGKKGVAGNLARGKIAGAIKASGHAVAQVANNHIIQASFGNIAVPAAILAGAAKGGAKGALAAVKNAANNPIVKAELAATAIVFPPLAPVSAGGIAAMEATSRVVDGIRSGNPAQIAQAAMQIGATQLLGQAGNAGAQRALSLMKGVDKARTLATGTVSGARQAVAAIQRGAAAGDPKAKTQLALVQHQAIREAHKTIAATTAHPAAKAKARNVIASAQLSAPAMLTATVAGINSPKGVRAGDFAVQRTGRILYRGKPVRAAKAVA